MKQALLLVAALSTASFARPALAATSQKVDQSVWGVSGLPSYVNMYIYVPDKLATKPPILVASHHCQGTAASTYSETKSSFVAQADKNGFIIIFPEATGHNCWDVGSAKSLKHDGGGDTHAIAQMVRYTLTKYSADATRVYAFGGSSGAMMTQALMGVYPDLFAAGVAISGVPCGCWAVDYTGDVASNGQWSGPCAGGQVSKTAKEWGDLVRSMFPSYSGHRPRLQLWHGTADTTISYKNLAEAVKEWTNVLSLSQTPTTTDTKFGGTHQLWKSQCGFGALETFAVDGAGHGVSWDVNTAVGFLGLDQAGGPDPEAAACPPTGGGGSAGSGGGGRAGNSAGGGSSAGAGGALQMGGSGGTMPAAGGSTSSAGAAGAGLPASGAGGATDGSAGKANASGGAVQGGAASIAGANAGGAPTSAGSNGSNGDNGSGCSCSLARRTDRGVLRLSLLSLLGIGLVLRRRRSRAHAE
ncbi:MAG TPA: PHB depolymerase family esterase [Polyangiaceae bacterium]|nr:PHB depolymerase family esterase [Polyangiaceae bacterium]